MVYATALRLLEGTVKSTGLANGSEVVRLLGVGTASLVHTADMVGQFPGQPGYISQKPESSRLNRRKSRSESAN